MSHEIFETHPNLEKVHVTSDNTPFYQENDAKNHGKTLKDKTVETVYNPKALHVEESEELTGEDLEMAEFLAAEKKAEDCRLQLAEFDPETTKYPEALKLFKALGLEAENEKKDTIYPLLEAAKANAQEGVNTQE
jgi:hypothetical protein